MDTNKDRQQYSEYGLGEFGVGGGRGCLTLLAALVLAALFISMLPQ